MPKPKIILFAALMVAAPAALAGSTLAAPTLAVGVRTTGPVENANDVQELEEGIPKQFASGLESAGYVVQLVNDAPTAARIRECSSDDCLQNVTTTGVATIVAQVSVEVRRSTRRGRDYNLFVVLARTASGRQLWREKHACRNCSIDEAKHLAFLVGAQLAEEVSKAPPVAAASRPPEDPVLQTPPPPATVVPEANGGISRLAEHERGSSSFSVPRYVPWIALGASAVALASGLYMLSIDDEPSCDLGDTQRRCPERYDTKTPGGALVAVGGALALAGIASFFLREPEERQVTSITITPAGIAISGSF
jgi:hypothetical protein